MFVLLSPHLYWETVSRARLTVGSVASMDDRLARGRATALSPCRMGPTPRRRRTRLTSGADCAHRGLPDIHCTYVVNQNVPTVYEVAIQTGL